MKDALVRWLPEAGKERFLATAITSMLPVIELHGGLLAFFWRE